jgi:hypothetical protein
LSTPVLVRHDPGCRYARPEHGGHTDAAKRMADHYNLHKAAGALNGWWLAFALADGAHDGEAYQSKAEAVRHQNHSEWWFAFLKISPGTMTTCQAESLLMMYRQQSRLKLADRDDKRGGYDVIPRLAIEDHWRQMAALKSGRDFVGLGYR